MMSDKPQLLMSFTRFAELKAPEPVHGYGLRSYRPGDEDAWIDILSTGEFGVWDRARLDRLLAGERAPMPLDGIFFATQDDRPVGTACTFLYYGEQGEFSEVGWVAVHPLHRGHRLGRQICLAVLGFARQSGHQYTFLKTEDYRPAAIKNYLQLGFEPEMTDPSHPERWEELRRMLSI